MCMSLDLCWYHLSLYLFVLCTVPTIYYDTWISNKINNIFPSIFQIPFLCTIVLLLELTKYGWQKNYSLCIGCTKVWVLLLIPTLLLFYKLWYYMERRIHNMVHHHHHHQHINTIHINIFLYLHILDSIWLA